MARGGPLNCVLCLLTKHLILHGFRMLQRLFMVHRYERIHLPMSYGIESCRKQLNLSEFVIFERFLYNCV